MVNIQTKELQGIPCTDLQIYFSENNIWRGSQVFRAIAVQNSMEVGLFENVI